MNDEVVNKRYADAFLSFARDSIGFDKGLDELLALKHIFTNTPELEAFLESRQVTHLEKVDLIEKTLGASFSEELIDFVKLLLDKNRINKFIDIAEYARLEYSHGVERDALLKTSYPVDTNVIQNIKNALEEKFNKKFHLYLELDPNLLGGIYVKMGNIIIDGSVRRRLEDLREKLTILKVV